MADVIFGEYSKKIIRLGLALVHKKLGVSTKIVAEDLQYCQNPVIRGLNKVLLAGSNNIKRQHQSQRIKEVGQLFLWIMYKDTAYRDVFFWMLYQVLKRADKILPLIEPYVKDPEDWTPNLWHESKQQTKKLRKEGKLPDYAKSMEETIFTPSIQDRRHQKILKGK